MEWQHIDILNSLKKKPAGYFFQHEISYPFTPPSHFPFLPLVRRGVQGSSRVESTFPAREARNVHRLVTAGIAHEDAPDWDWQR